MGLQEHDLIMADEKFSGKTVKKNIFPRLLDKTAWTAESVPLKDSKNAKTMNSKNQFRRSGTLSRQVKSKSVLASRDFRFTEQEYIIEFENESLIPVYRLYIITS